MTPVRLEPAAPRSQVKHSTIPVLMAYVSQCQNSSKFLSVSYLMKTADVIMIFFSSHNTTDHT